MKKWWYIGYWILSLTWGIVMTFIGLCAALGLLIGGHKPIFIGPNICFIVGHQWGGLSLGPVIIVAEQHSTHMLQHEGGHGLQNILMGPLFPFLVGIPSACRYHYRNYLVDKKGYKWWQLPEYDSIWFEGCASKWGEKVYNEVTA